MADSARTCVWNRFSNISDLTAKQHCNDAQKMIVINGKHEAPAAILNPVGVQQVL